MTRLCLLAFALLVLAVACSDKEEKKKDESAWTAKAVWSFQDRAYVDAWSQACGSSPAVVKAGDQCVIDAMTRSGANQEAVDFLRQNGFFLIAFLEVGRVDYGRGAAPWFNMGRPTQQLFLNGTPAVQEASMLIPRDWQMDAEYADFAKRQTQAFPWGEYGELIDSVSIAGGGQEFRLEFPLRVCRACPDLAYLRMDYSFDAEGGLVDAVLGPLGTP